jgi:hypothetical protein
VDFVVSVCGEMNERKQNFCLHPDEMGFEIFSCWFFLNTYSPFTSGLVLAFIKIQIFIKNPIFLSPTHCKGWKSNRLKVKDS